MSCQLNLLAAFQDVSQLKKYLFPRNKQEEKAEQDSSDGWDNADWGWKEDDETTADDDESASESSLSWLQSCKVSLSPTRDFLAIASDERLVLLALKWDPQEKSDFQTKFSVVFEGNVTTEEGVVHDVVAFRSSKVKCQTSEQITSILCLPLASQKRSTHGGPDWTCVLVGYNTGYVRMYTENGTLLLSQIFSEEPVVAIKCRTYEPPRHAGDAEKHEELSILYRSALVIIDGFSFFQSLRACRNQVARATASGSELIQPPPLAYKKWALQDQERLHDHISCGLVTPNPFDQLQTGSMLGGYTATIKPTPPAAHLYLSAGVQPCVGFFYAIEGSAQPMLSDVAHAVASKLKSALFSQISAASGWFGLGSKQNADTLKEKKRPKIEPAAALPARFGIRDQRRTGETIVFSPDHCLAATTDSFGRVMLIDIRLGVATRMWKGYRDAQVGWVSACEDGHASRQSKPRHALFLIIYAPRRGILEVWTAQQGPRVAAFNISKWCQLLCPSYGMMGLNNVTYHSTKLQSGQCYLVDPSGSVKVIEVPFHLALSDKNSKRARDLHLLKKLKLVLKENSEESDSLQTEVIDSLLDMKIPSIRQQGLERVLHTSYLSASFMLSVVCAIKQHLQPQGAAAEDYESRSLRQFCGSQERLLHTYNRLSQLCAGAALKPHHPEATNVQELMQVLSIKEEEAKQLAVLLDHYHAALDSSHPHVSFHDDDVMMAADFLACFTCHMVREEKTSSEAESDGPSGGSCMQVKLHSSLSEGRYNRLANFLFKRSLERGPPVDLSIILTDSCIPPDQLLALLLHLWLSVKRRCVEETKNLQGLVRCLSNLKNACASQVGQSLRNTCAASLAVGPALLAALVGRGVASETLPKTEPTVSVMTDSTRSDDLSGWETLTLNNTHWNLLVRQLEDLVALATLLHTKPSTVEMVTHTYNVTASVKQVLDGGHGVLPELVAKWIVGHGILPSMLCLSTDETEDLGKLADKAAEEKPKTDPPNPIISALQAVQKRLPLSLDADVLMANCAWEYLRCWERDTEVIFPLQQALAYLQCVQNAVLQHGVASMMWHMFIVKKLSAAAYLMEKVGKAPKERLCRRDVGMSDVSLEKFMGVAVDILDTIIQASRDVSEVPVLHVEDAWGSIAGPTSLAQLATEQKTTNLELATHHLHLAVILHAVLAANMKSVKPLSLFDTKGRNAFFKPLQSSPVLPSRVIDDSIATARKQFVCRVVTFAVENMAPISPVSTASSVTVRSNVYTHWPALMLRIARDLPVDMDLIRRHHVIQLYSSGLDKLAEEVLLTVSDHSMMGSEMLVIAGQRLHHVLFCADAAASVDKLAKCPPTVSSWIKSLNPNQLRCPDPPLKYTAALIGQAVNQLPESHSEYNLAISLVDLVQSLS